MRSQSWDDEVLERLRRRRDERQAGLVRLGGLGSATAGSGGGTGTCRAG